MIYIIESSAQALTWGLFAFFVVREVVFHVHDQEL
jgi:hypothetical protein